MLTQRELEALVLILQRAPLNVAEALLMELIIKKLTDQLPKQAPPENG